MTSAKEADFIPATRAISIGRGVVYRPIRSWHSGVFSGERLAIHGEDRSGCILGQLRGLDVTMPPKSVTHRLYWNEAAPDDAISAFLSYPGGMSCVTEYHWEALRGDVERFMSEEELETWVLSQIGSTDEKGGAE